MLCSPSAFEHGESTPTGLPTPASAPLVPFSTTSATCSSPRVPGPCPDDALGVWGAYRGFPSRGSVTVTGSRPWSRKGTRSTNAHLSRLQGFGPRGSPLPPSLWKQARGPDPLLAFWAPPGSHCEAATLASDPPTAFGDPHVTPPPRNRGSGSPPAETDVNRRATREKPGPRSICGTAARRTFESVTPRGVLALPSAHPWVDGKRCPVVKDQRSTCGLSRRGKGQSIRFGA
jgi:hypothetical protein